MKVRELDRVEWHKWLDGRPESVRSVAEKYTPDTLYVLTTTGQRCEIVAYDESGRVRVYMDPAFNEMQFTPLEVYGINPADLVPSPHQTPKYRTTIVKIVVPSDVQ